MTTMEAQPLPLAPVKPRLRGWSHLASGAPMLAVTIVLVVLASGHPGRQWALGLYGASATWLFLVSGVYHTFTWDEPRRQFLRRVDHANIFLLVAGTYTPVTLTLLDGAWKVSIIVIVWAVAAVGIALVVPSMSLPRPLIPVCYLFQGWIAVVALPSIAGAAGGGGLALLLVAGGLYSLGAVCYALRRPVLIPGWFEYHEVFHLLVIAANACFVVLMITDVVHHP